MEFITPNVGLGAPVYYSGLTTTEEEKAAYDELLYRQGAILSFILLFYCFNFIQLIRLVFVFILHKTHNLSSFLE